MFIILNSLKFTFDDYDQKIKDLESRKNLLEENCNILEHQYNLVFNSKKKEEMLSYSIITNHHYKLYEPIEGFYKSYLNTNKELEPLHKQYKELSHQYKCLIEKYNRQLFKNNQMFSVIKVLENFNRNYDLIKFGYDKTKNLICFISNSISENSILDKSIIYSYLIDKDCVENNEYGYSQVKYKAGHNYIELMVIDMKNNKNLSWGTFTLACLENTLIIDINRKISIYKEVSNLNSYDLPLINEIRGTIGGLFDDIIARNKRKKFYQNNGYKFNGENFLKHL